jgi:hypothetical protein
MKMMKGRMARTTILKNSGCVATISSVQEEMSANAPPDPPEDY